MQPNQSITTLLKRLWHHISPRRLGQFGLLLMLMLMLMLMLLTSFAATLSIGAVLPFIRVLTAPERVFEHTAAQPIIRALGEKADMRLLPMQAGDVLRTYADVKSIVRNTQFNTNTELRVGIDAWAKWYKSNYV
jgi:hypothetical protein